MVTLSLIFNIIFNIDILNEKLTADNNDQFGGYTRLATVQPGITTINIIVKYVVRRIVQKDPVTHSYIYSPDFSNTYYYPITDHIRLKNPLFTGSVRLSSSLCASISAVQK